MDGTLSYAQLVRLPSVPQFLVAACLSRLAGRMFMLAIVLYALDRFRSPALAGWIAFAAMAPGFVISPLAGALLDRVGAAMAIVVDLAASAVLVFSLVAAGHAGIAGAPLLMAIVALYSLTSPLGAAGIRALIPRLVPESALSRANALDSFSYALIDVLGPALAGALFGFAGANATMLAIALLYGAAAISLSPLARRTPARPGARPGRLIGEAIGGLSYVMRHRALRGLAVSYALYQVSWGILLVAVPVLVGREIGIGSAADAAVGGIWALSGVAGGLGALWAGHLRSFDRERRFIVLGILATAFAIYPVGAVAGIYGLGLGLTLVGFMSGPVDVCVLTLRQRRTDPDWLGRVMAVSMSLNMSGLPLGSALGGVLVTHSLTASLATAALASVLAAVATYVLVPAEP